MTQESQKLSVLEKVGYSLGDLAANLVLNSSIILASLSRKASFTCHFTNFQYGLYNSRRLKASELKKYVHSYQQYSVKHRRLD